MRLAVLCIREDLTLLRLGVQETQTGKRLCLSSGEYEVVQVGRERCAIECKARQHLEQPESINDKYVVEMIDSNVIPNSSDMCDNEKKAYQNAEKYEDERVVLAI
ncbi:hypothetical protein Tco_1440967 [Tanacetum coccineum]